MPAWRVRNDSEKEKQKEKTRAERERESERAREKARERERKSERERKGAATAPHELTCNDRSTDNKRGDHGWQRRHRSNCAELCRRYVECLRDEVGTKNTVKVEQKAEKT